MGKLAIAVDTSAFAVHGTEVELSAGFPLHGGLAIPPSGLTIVLWDSLPFGVHETNVVLSAGIALLGGSGETLPE